MQLQYPMLAKVEVEMTQEKEMDTLPNRPSEFISILQCFTKQKEQTQCYAVFLSFSRRRGSKNELYVF